MDVSVVLERVDDNGYRASTFSPTHLVAEAETKAEALARLGEELSQRLSGAEVVQLHVPVSGETNPWKAISERLSGHPDLDAVEENMREYRRQVDNDDRRP